MFKLFAILGGLILLTASHAFSASVCTDGSLSTYATAGYTCTIGGTLFSGFTYSGPLDAKHIEVSPVDDGLGLTFSSDRFEVTSNSHDGNTAQYLISYSVLFGGPLPGTTTLSVLGGDVNWDGTYEVSESGLTASPLNITQASTPQTTTSTFLPSSVYNVSNHIFLSAPYGTASNHASVDGITNLFEAGGSVTTPEPSGLTLVLCGAALLLAGRTRFKRS